MLCFNPNMRLRKAESNVFCYSIDTMTMDVKNHKTMHPIEAVLLCLFNGKRNKYEIIDLLNKITCTPMDQTEKFVDDFIEKSSDFLVENEINENYNPVDFMMSISKVNMNKIRLLSPLSLVMLITYQCTSNCLYCYANRNSQEDKNEMDIDFAKKIVDQAKDCNIDLIYLGGGDPFKKEWVINLIEYINNYNIYLMLSTKEYLSSSKCKQLASVGVTRMQVSIDTLNEKDAEILTGRKRFRKEILETIKNLQSEGIEVFTNSVVTKYNYKELPELIDYLIAIGIKIIVLSRYNRTIYQHRDTLFVDDEDIRWLNDEIELIDKPDNVFLMHPKPNIIKQTIDEKMKLFLNRAACSFGRTGLVVTPSGKVIPCEQLPTTPTYILGDLAINTLQEVWNSEKVLSMLYPKKSHFMGTECFDCNDFTNCIYTRGWCIRDIFKVYNSDVGVQPNCPKSNHTMRLM